MELNLGDSMAANVQQYIFAGARVKVTGSSTSRSRIDTKILGYDEPAKKLLAVTAKSISVAAAGAPSLTAGKRMLTEGPHSKSCWKRATPERCSKRKRQQINMHANCRAVDRKARCCLVDLSVKCGRLQAVRQRRR